MGLKECRHMVRQLIRPSVIAERLEDVDARELSKRGFRTIILDIDDTVAHSDSTQVSLQKSQWVEQAKTFGFHVFAVSNNSSGRRIQKICRQLNIQGLYFAMKPLPFTTIELLSDFGLHPHRTIIIGDKILTDIVLGNWIGAHTILVDPLDKKQSLIKTLQRNIELHLLRHI